MGPRAMLLSLFGLMYTAAATQITFEPSDQLTNRDVDVQFSFVIQILDENGLRATSSSPVSVGLRSNGSYTCVGNPQAMCGNGVAETFTVFRGFKLGTLSTTVAGLQQYEIVDAAATGFTLPASQTQLWNPLTTRTIDISGPSATTVGPNEAVTYSIGPPKDIYGNIVWSENRQVSIYSTGAGVATSTPISNAAASASVVGLIAEALTVSFSFPNSLVSLVGATPHTITVIPGACRIGAPFSWCACP